MGGAHHGALPDGFVTLIEPHRVASATRECLWNLDHDGPDAGSDLSCALWIGWGVFRAYISSGAGRGGQRTRRYAFARP